MYLKTCDLNKYLNPVRAVLVLGHRESPETSRLGARFDPVSDGLTS